MQVVASGSTALPPAQAFVATSARVRAQSPSLVLRSTSVASGYARASAFSAVGTAPVGVVVAGHSAASPKLIPRAGMPMQACATHLQVAVQGVTLAQQATVAVQGPAAGAAAPPQVATQSRQPPAQVAERQLSQRQPRLSQPPPALSPVKAASVAAGAPPASAGPPALTSAAPAGGGHGANGHCAGAARGAAPPDLPARRLPKPHGFFPFDLFSGRAHEGLLQQDLQDELSYVKDHCMLPPYPWGQVVYHDFLVDKVLREVPGDLAEFGMGQGGTSIFLARLAKKFGRKCLAVDSFEGLPPPDIGKDNPYFLQGDYRARGEVDNYESFLRYKERFDVDDSLYTIKSFFKDAEIPEEFENFAFVHMDSDLYDSVYDSLVKVWDKVSVGGVIAIDDFFHHAQGPARAVSDFFRALNGEPPLMFAVPTYAVLIVKGRSAFLRWEERSTGRQAPAMYCPRALDGNYYSFSLVRACEPFIRAVETSARRAAEAASKAEELGKPDAAGLRRAHNNAEAFLAFLRYPDDGARSGQDILRYCLPLEDLFDISEGNLCGMPGVERNHIEIPI